MSATRQLACKVSQSQTMKATEDKHSEVELDLLML